MSFCSFFGGEVFQNHFEPGVYVCAKCGYELFSSRSKYAHSSPWPAFTETIHADSVAKRPEHNRAEALKVRGQRGVGGTGAARESREPVPPSSLCLPHSSRGLEASIPGLLPLPGSCHPRLSGEPSLLVQMWETGQVSCTGSRTKVNLLCRRSAWEMGVREETPSAGPSKGLHCGCFVARSSPSCLVIFPGVLWQVWQRVGPRVPERRPQAGAVPILNIQQLAEVCP
ncbi:MSRB1 isoform 4 [Pongo abelii]|uniref:Methionine-R-sulfoxide reductase B1 n=1 Tax=Pongo abelii TaxID=9601 RepID=A0A8I5YMY0_PONAB|nr:MSRB1 isoform 4 [Pongo abelii]